MANTQQPPRLRFPVSGINYGGATIMLDPSDVAGVLQYIKNDQWVMLVGISAGVPVAASWYRVVGVDDARRPVSLVGPD